MSLGICLISSDGYYLGANGELPTRPVWDKEVLKYLAEGHVILCSPNTSVSLPQSIVERAKDIVIDPELEHDINFGIRTFAEAPPSVFLLVKSREPLLDGRRFKIEWLERHYTNMFETEEISLWTLKQ